MATQEVNLPDIGEGVTEGELIKWLVGVGDTVEEDQPVAEVMTDKATVEVPTPVAGTVAEFKVSEGDIVPIDTCMLVVNVGEKTVVAKTKQPVKESSESQSAPASTPVSSSAAESTPQKSTNGAAAVEPPVAESHVLATPGTRRLAREANVDINQIEGSGLAGRVTREDVLAHQSEGEGQRASAVAPTPSKIEVRPYVGGQGVEERVPLRGIRRKIAETMQYTKQVVPHFTIMDEANVTELVKVRNQAKDAGAAMGIKVTYLPFVMKALIATMREFPKFNASIDDAAEEIVYKKYFNIGFAADTPSGLLVPVIKDADQKSILELSQEIVDLSLRARDGKLKLDEMKGATITITNIGSVGGTYATPIINHPEVAIMGMYKMTDKPVFRDGKFRAAKVMNYTMTCDHRLIDGAEAARFLASFIQRIENPSRLFLEMR
ncbi:MAG: 2-oxo acid dehydrogenase subunit E2 [Bdellovibrionales bacterium]|nr:2-oxo acid dehydrogenase subunit E2 [Bdellovibrionales bacterium]